MTQNASYLVSEIIAAFPVRNDFTFTQIITKLINVDRNLPVFVYTKNMKEYEVAPITSPMVPTSLEYRDGEIARMHITEPTNENLITVEKFLAMIDQYLETDGSDIEDVIDLVVPEAGNSIVGVEVRSQFVMLEV